MENKKGNLITRRQALLSLGTLAAGTIIKPSSILGYETTTSKTRFAVIGDFGTGCDDQIGIGKCMLDHHGKLPFDFVLTVGDNIYPNGAGRYFSKNFEDPFAGLLRDQVPFYAVFGNHDVEEGRQDQLQYPNFNMAGKRYYNVRKANGMVEFFMLDSTDMDITQISWLENALKTSTARWKIALTHHSLYSSAKKHGDTPKLREKIEPLFTRYGVKVAFAGHDHTYERTKPQQDVQYFVTGAGGKIRRGDLDRKSPILAVGYDRDNSFMVIELDEREMSFQSVCETGQIVDNGLVRMV